MATFSYRELASAYGGFEYPFIEAKLNGRNITDNRAGFFIQDAEVDLTCGFEASMAVFHICNCFDKGRLQFLFPQLKSYICLGSSVELALGYGNRGRTVFVGFITRVEFIYDELKPSAVEVTAMDIKRIMMSGRYAGGLKAASYGEAVREILSRSAYDVLSRDGAVTEFEISDTPDKQSGAGSEQKESAVTIDLVNESDYEFVVRAAKRFGFEFFVEGGKVIFREAKAVSDVLIELSPGDGLRTLRAGYDLSGLVESVEARAMDVGKGELITAKTPFHNKVSTGSKAQSLIKDSARVTIDPTVNSVEEAQRRANTLMQEISYRFGSLEALVPGLPELAPGYFIDIAGLGKGADNRFYVTDVHHSIEAGIRFETQITGKAAAIEPESGGGFF